MQTKKKRSKGIKYTRAPKRCFNCQAPRYPGFADLSQGSIRAYEVSYECGSRWLTGECKGKKTNHFVPACKSLPKPFKDTVSIKDK